MPDKHSDTDEVREQVEDWMDSQRFDPDFPKGVNFATIQKLAEYIKPNLQMLLTSEKRKLLLKLSKQNYLGAVPMDAIDNELASLEQLGEL